MKEEEELFVLIVDRENSSSNKNKRLCIQYDYFVYDYKHVAIAPISVRSSIHIAGGRRADDISS